MKLGWGAIILGLWGWIFVAAGGEGRILPAAELTITKAVAATDRNFTKIYGRVERLRPDCAFREMRWYLGGRDGSNVPVDSRFMTTTRVRENGVTSFGPWEVEVLPADIMAKAAFADAYHQCALLGIPLPWLTRSQVWN